ncbi:diuretic hormone class 2 [Oratosquilla oratoria]|uniref:diuretic hormone class 2 n=1 Tax=Oratosquilla oratoria TaxID=337810 RepID=UPI003F76736C
MNHTLAAFVSFIAVFLFVSSTSAASINRERRAIVEIDDPDYVLELLTRLGHSIVRANELENAKRGLDLGLGRGFSGSQAAKHLMGLAAANFAGGPGRRRRSPKEDLQGASAFAASSVYSSDTLPAVPRAQGVSSSSSSSPSTSSSSSSSSFSPKLGQAEEGGAVSR